jgi:hypothetical protein
MPLPLPEMRLHLLQAVMEKMRYPKNCVRRKSRRFSTRNTANATTTQWSWFANSDKNIRMAARRGCGYWQLRERIPRIEH